MQATGGPPSIVPTLQRVGNQLQINLPLIKAGKLNLISPKSNSILSTSFCRKNFPVPRPRGHLYDQVWAADSVHILANDVIALWPSRGGHGSFWLGLALDDCLSPGQSFRIAWFDLLDSDPEADHGATTYTLEVSLQL